MSFKSVTGVLFSEDRAHVLLILRRDVPVWVLPGGGVESNESPEEAVVREILEETGVCVKVSRLVGSYLPINRLSKPTLLYECAYLSGAPCSSAETRSARFWPLSDLPPLPPPYDEWIEDARGNHPPLQKRLTAVTYSRLLKEAVRHPLLVCRFLLSRLGLPFND